MRHSLGAARMRPESPPARGLVGWRGRAHDSGFCNGNTLLTETPRVPLSIVFTGESISQLRAPKGIVRWRASAGAASARTPRRMRSPR